MFETPHRLHPAAIIIKFGAYLLVNVRTMGVPLLAVIFSRGRGSTQHLGLLTIGIAIAALGAISFIGPIVHFLSTTFVIQGDALNISSGFIWRKRRSIPLARIQNVNVERTLWHRILGAAAVKVETAAGGHTEGDLSALSLEDANKLQAVLLQRSAGAAPPELAPEQKPKPLYQLSTKEVFIAGALGNRALYIVGSMIAVFQHEGSRELLSPIGSYFSRLGPVMAVLYGIVSFVLLALVGWILSIVISATRFYNFRMEKHDRGLLLTHGLITQFRSIVPVGRIQDVRIEIPLFFRLFGYAEVYADTAGSFDKKDQVSANKMCPLLREEEIERIGKLLLPEFQIENLDWKRVSTKTIPRHAVRYLLLLSLFSAWPLYSWLGLNALWAAIPLAIYSWVIAVLYYRYTAFAFNRDLLVSRRGVFRKRLIVIPFDRIQHYSVDASFAQRWLGLATITAVTASSTGHPAHIPDVPADVADSLRRTIGASIRSHLGNRRGGL